MALQPVYANELVCIPTRDEVVKKAGEAFEKRFGKKASFCGIAPGRVNLIGEHTDYNDGFVLPMALPMVTVVVGSENPSHSNFSRVLTLSAEADNPHETDIQLPPTPGKPAWANYVKGVLANFHSDRDVPTFDAVVATSVPLGGGVSSSASLEVATYMFLAAMTSQLDTLSLKSVAQACQTAEHRFANMPCGIMDQMVACLARAQSALLLDCRSLETELVPLDDPQVVVLITNSNVRHHLTGSEYPSRRRSCEKAAEFFQVKSLREVDSVRLNAAKDNLDAEMFARARHVVTEIERTQQAAQALQKRDYVRFGKLMNESHQSMKNDYEISCPEVDELTEAAQSVAGVYGSRMTGGGFGGCTVTLVKREAVGDVIKAVNDRYTGKATFYLCQASEGCQGFQLV